jgi:hypothetical protein
MTPAFESFLARLYVDRDARARFLADPRGEAASAAALAIDRVGLELAAASFAHKRRRLARPGPLRRVQRRVSAWLLSWS